MEKITLTTSDGLNIIGDFYEAPGVKAALLLHAIPKTRRSWQPLTAPLREKGFKVLTIDFRGHGESSDGPDGYKRFLDSDHQKGILDIQAAIAFLKTKKVTERTLTIIGASIGANLAIEYAAIYPDIKQLVLLSPGLNYRGVEADLFISRLSPNARALFIASRDDDGVAAMAQALYGLMPQGAEKQMITYEAAGHGTDMFQKEQEQPELIKAISDWLK
ncbi:MAG: alpha/beta fold hydrolase [bacterium]|nr:alpha/beta fold hydrolase [bacterium]